MANLIMGHGVSGCFGTSLAPKTPLIRLDLLEVLKRDDPLLRIGNCVGSNSSFLTNQLSAGPAWRQYHPAQAATPETRNARQQNVSTELQQLNRWVQ